MKKSKFIVGLSAAFLSSVALMSCSSIIKPRSGVILTIDGVPYTAEDLFKDQKTPAAAEAKFNAVYKVAVRAYFKKNTEDNKEIERETKIKISEQKSVAQSNADKNHTSYDVEWKKILDSNGVKSEKELYNKFEYDLQKEKFENKFYESHYKNLRELDYFSDETKGKVEFTNYLKGKQPYHIKHILVKIAGMKAGDGVNAEITRDEAKNLAGVIENLANGVDFETVSNNYNDDESAKDNGGSLGIMSRDTSFVNDFKLGIYLYESYFGSSTQGGTTEFLSKDALEELGLDNPNKNIKDAKYYARLLGKNDATSFGAVDPEIIDPTSADTTGANGFGIGQIPYEAALNLKKYAEYDFDGGAESPSNKVIERFSDVNLGKEDVAAKFYPRNVIFNKYFNKHNIMVITPNKVHDYKTSSGELTNKNIKDWVSGKKRTTNLDRYYGDVGAEYNALDGFDLKDGTITPKNGDTVIPKLPYETGGSSDTVLRDNHGRVILVFRSGTGGSSSSNDDYQGIHFVVIERSPFIGKEFDNATQDDNATTREEYYTHYYPGQPGGKHPTYTDGGKDWKKTFVYYFKDKESTKLKDRADTVKSELKKCDPKLDTYLYQHLCIAGDIKFNKEVAEGIDIEKDINDWITINRESKKFDDKKNWDETWQEYYYSLESQHEQREEVKDATTVHSRLIPEACAIAFADDSFLTNDIKLDTLFGKGGIWHE